MSFMRFLLLFELLIISLSWNNDATVEAFVVSRIPSSFRPPCLVVSGTNTNELESLTVKELKDLLEQYDLKKRGVMSLLKRKQDYIDYLATHLPTIDKNGENPAEEEQEDIIEEDALSLELEEDETSYEEYKNQLENLVALSCEATTDNNRDVQERAQAIFDAMYEAHLFDEKPPPTVDIYNNLLLIYGNTNNATMSQCILDQMISSNNGQQHDSVPQPNLDAFLYVMEAWGNEFEPSKADGVLELLQQYNSSLQPNTQVYNTLLKAWLKSRGPNNEKSKRAESILQEANSMADLKTWERVIKCMSCPQTNASTDKVMDLFQQLKDLSKQNATLIPNVDVYNAVIRAIATNQDVPFYKICRERGQQAESLLYECLEQSKEVKSNDDCQQQQYRPNVGTFINVIRAYWKSPDPMVCTKVEKLMELFQTMSQQLMNDETLRPNVRLYNAVLDVMARSRHINKAKSTQQVLQDMQQEGVVPNTKTYNAVLNACAYTKSNHAKVKLQTFRIAVDTWNQLCSKEENKPNAVSYGLFLTCCAALLPRSNPKRDQVVEKVFGKCCLDHKEDSKFVLESLQAAASPELFDKLLREN